MKIMRNEFLRTQQKKILTVKIKDFPIVKNFETVIEFPFLVENWQICEMGNRQYFRLG